jgi:hypothetical protein
LLIFYNFPVSQYGLEKILEPCAIQINLGKYNLIVIHLCRSPSGDFAQFIHSLDLMLKYLYKPGLVLILCGDINANFLTDSCHKMEIISLFQCYNLFNVNDFSTRIENESGSVIDSIFIYG